MVYCPGELAGQPKSIFWTRFYFEREMGSNRWKTDKDAGRIQILHMFI